MQNLDDIKLNKQECLSKDTSAYTKLAWADLGQNFKVG